MPKYLVTLSLGPVQSLIEAARRTRDLWCGSWLLSEAARAAARVLHNAQPGCLIFPSPDNPDQELLPQREPGDSANIANILRAEVTLPNADAARALCVQAKIAAAERLKELGEQARRKLKVKLRDEVWQAQINDLLEGFAAWVEIPDGDNNYQQASIQLGATLAARKATRDFQCAEQLRTKGLPKSSLDGAMETVLPKHWHEEHRARRQLGLSDKEQLDALGVMKRLAGNPEQFTAYSRIAADPWIQGLNDDQRQTLCNAYAPLIDPKLATRVSGNLEGNQSIYAAFPYDAQMLYDFRLDNTLSSGGEDAPNSDESDALHNLRKVIKVLPKEVGAPVPYAVILKADGDRMGALLQRAQTAEDSRAISKALHGFASSVREIVREHRGHAIYAGGDDVLALVSLPDAVPCAQKLARAFEEALKPVVASLAADQHPTLSVGLAIGHLMEPLGNLRARANRAEKLAKGDTEAKPRNALAIMLGVRSGGELAGRANWSDQPKKLAKGDGLPSGQTRNARAIMLGVRSGGELAWRANWDDQPAFDALEKFTQAYCKRELPSRVAYDLRAIDRRLDWLRDDQTPTANGMRKAEVVRMLDRARHDGGTKELSKDIRKLILEQVDCQPLNELADTLILTRWLAARTAADLGEKNP